MNAVVVAVRLLLVTALVLPLPSSAAAPKPKKSSSSASPSSSAQNDGALPAMLGAAVTAADEERYCDALYLFESLNLRSPSPRALYNAAEVAYAAGDRVKALDLYRATQQRYPGFDKRALVQARADRVFKDMIKLGPGTACAVRTDTCGDWRFVATVEGGEQCDDGNVVDGDGCDKNCTLTGCGNGIVTAGEQCDDGNDVDGDGCDRNCTISACGNGVATSGEQCDDGNVIDGDGCDHNCRPTGCGNGVQTTTEECDDGNTTDGDGCDGGCRLSRCGNAVVTGLEQCDDGNAVDGDGCESTCLRTEVHQPIPGIVVAVVSAAAVVGGGYLAFTGVQAVDDADALNRELDARNDRFADDPEGSVSGVDEARAAALAASDNASTWGLPLIVGGTTLAGAGVVGLGVGIWFAITHTDVEGGAR
ncbi:MAG TPA: DUF4215 domain-containing protein [Myxococcota bacterium]